MSYLDKSYQETEDLPYTPEELKAIDQARKFGRGGVFIYDRDGNMLYDAAGTRALLRALHSRGIRVVVPLPRFYTNEYPHRHEVYDRETRASVATFRGQDADLFAGQHAKRLNKENKA